MKLTEWKTLFAPHILYRGQNYFYDGRVEDLRIKGNTVTASVFGSEKYEVEIEIENGQVTDLFCTCPYAEGGETCKHMAAVLYELTEEETSRVISKENGEAESFDSDLEAAVQSLRPEDAKQLLLDLGRNIDRAAELILLRSSGKVTQDQKDSWEERVCSITGRYADRDGFIRYDKVTDYIYELEEVLSENIPILLGKGLITDAFELTCMVFSEAMTTDMDDDGDLGWMYLRCEDYWKTLLAAADEQQALVMHQWFLEQYRDPDNDCVQDWIADFLFQNLHDERVLKELLVSVDEQLRQAEQEKSRYYLEQLVARRLELMEKGGLSQEAIEQFENSYYDLPYIRKRLIGRAMDHKQYDEAIRLLKESKKLDAGLPGLASDYSETLMQLYEELGRRTEYRDELFYHLRTFRQDNLEIVERLKAITEPEDWPDLRDELLTWGTIKGAFLPFLQKEGLYKGLLDEVIRSDSLWILDRYEAVLRDRYPDELRDHIVSHLTDAMRTASDRKQYAALIYRLKSLKKYPCGDEEAKKLALEWRVEYRRRRSLLDELSKAGF